jgi:predicted DNA binding CopG/RHH family protein
MRVRQLLLEREFAHALGTGRVSPSTGLKVAKTDAKILEQLMRRAKQKANRAISIRLPIADLEKAKEIAARTGLGYQTVLKTAIREGLKKAE